MYINFTQTSIRFSVFITLVALFFCAGASAQAKFSTVVNETRPGLNEYVQVEYTVENARSVETISAPSFKNFRLIQGPVQSSGMSVINGALSQFKSLSFVLQPLVAGKLNIPGAMAVVDGKTIRSNAVVIDVKNTGSGNSSGGGASPFAPRDWAGEEPRVSEEYRLGPGEKMSDKIKKNIFVTADVNKTVCYEGEPVMATFKLCSRLRSESTVLKRPSLNGFSVFDMIEPEANHPAVETIDGKAFNVHTIRKTQLFPLQPGTFTIDPVELTNKVTFLRTSESRTPSRDPMQRMMDNFFDEDGHGELEEQSFSLASKPVSIIVKPLPETGKPAGFNGAVGKFTVQSQLENTTVSTGDPVILKVQVKGAGNFTVINAPSISLPDELNAYDPVIKETVDKSVYPMSGVKTFTYTFTARKAGKYTIPAVTFSYFDPSKGAYQTARSDSFSLKVTRSFRKALLPFVHTASLSPGSFDFRQALYFGGLALLVCLVLVFLLYRLAGKRKKKSVIAVSAPGVPSVPVATDPSQVSGEALLQGARLALEEGRSQDFYGEVNKAVWKKISDSMQIPATELNKVNVATQLKSKGVDDTAVARLSALLNECEIALYTPVHSASDMQQTLVKAESVIEAL